MNSQVSGNLQLWTTIVELPYMVLNVQALKTVSLWSRYKFSILEVEQHVHFRQPAG